MPTILPPDTFAQIKTAAASAGETDSNDYIHETLHEAAREQVERLLEAAGHGDDDIDDDQLDELTLAYKDGFWEPTHLSERTTLRTLLERAWDALDPQHHDLRNHIRAALQEG